MNLREIKQLIVSRVTSVQGCKATELCVMPELVMAVKHGALSELPDILEEMIREGMLVEVEYELPSMPDRLKSFLLPAGAVIKVRGITDAN